jgi:arylsulfatase
MSSSGPYGRWPLGRDFERFYGFLGGETHQYYLALISDNHPVDPKKRLKYKFFIDWLLGY